MRKGRSVVHKNLEDNYGAVVIANHEALAQVLEQVIIYFNHYLTTASYPCMNEKEILYPLFKQKQLNIAKRLRSMMNLSPCHGNDGYV